MDELDRLRIFGLPEKPHQPIHEVVKTMQKQGDSFTNDEVLLKENKFHFNERYVKNQNSDYDTIIIIPSFERYDLVFNLLTILYSQTTDYKYLIILINDGSSDERYLKIKNNFPNLIYLKNDKTQGKYNYWKTINKLFDEVRKYSTNSILQLDDDFQPCNEFLNKIITLFYNKKTENNRILCISFHHYNEKHLHEKRWGLKYWVDGGGLYDINFIKVIDYKIDKILESRWSENKDISTGVWEQISKKINELGCKIYKTPKSYVEHLGFNHSKMNKIEKIETKGMATIKFIDNYDENIDCNRILQ